MKIFGTLRPYSRPDALSDAETSRDGETLRPADIYVWPDSCWLLSNRPLYIPDFASGGGDSDNHNPSGFSAVAMLALKVGRLGKSIAPRFACRYFAEYTAATLNLPDFVIESLRSGEMPYAMDACIDNAIVLGDWMKIPFDENHDSGNPTCRSAQEAAEILAKVLPENLTMQAVSADNAESRCSMNLTTSLNRSPEMLSIASARNTLKMGDILLLPLPAEPIPLRINLSLSISLPKADTLADNNNNNIKKANANAILFTKYK